MTPPPRYRLTLSEYQADAPLQIRIEGNCSAYVIGICEDRTGPLRVLTDQTGRPSNGDEPSRRCGSTSERPSG